MAACLILCPGSVRRWQKAARRGRGNRGRDLPRRWTGLDKHIEVKQTTYHDERRGHLIVRPPRKTPGEMRPEWIDDCYYVLMHGTPFAFQLCGWIDREELIREGQRNPIPVRPGQRDCWGIHWQKLRPLAELAARCT